MMNRLILSSVFGFMTLFQVCLAGAISGVVLDADEQPVVAAQVIITNQDGLPLIKEDYRPFLSAVSESQDFWERFSFANTDSAGAFRFDNVPAGNYRLVAQSWENNPNIQQLIQMEDGTNGAAVILHGTADSVVVTNETAATVTIRPMGSGSLHLVDETETQGSLVLLSAIETSADPILGFGGWAGPFLMRWIGFNQLTDDSDTVFRGLPAGELHFALFANDNNPGFSDGKVTIEEGKTTEVRTRCVASWSNGRHNPPDFLKPLIQEMREMDQTTLAQIFQRAKPPKAADPIDQFKTLPQHLNEIETMPSGTEYLRRDILAARAYMELEDYMQKRKAATAPTSSPIQETKRAINSCAENLAKINGAKQQFALETRKKAGDPVSDADIFGPTLYLREKPVCPLGGTYILGLIGEKPRCSLGDHMPSHTLPSSP